MPSLSLFFALAVGIFSTAASAQTFNRTFSVSADSADLEAVNQIGSIKVLSGGTAGKIVINAKMSDGEAKIDAVQNAQGKVSVQVRGRGTVDMEITAPQSANLDLLCFKCTVLVTNMTGPLHARNTDGQILITGLRSPRVEAHSTKGNISFSGEILPSGNYTLKSYSGRVDVTLPVNADFKLSASSYRGGIDLGGFPFHFDKQSDQLVEAMMGAGRATVAIWTQEGSIHLHRKP
ncbi:MAG: DUF4097 family beta strand repeat-containing protein [Blastocatellia bacterium]